MAEATSPASGQRYGVQRVCRAWGVPRSSFYAARQPKPGSAEQRPPARRGPKPATSDEALLAAIRKDLDLSPWTGEGHRKVWARLRVPPPGPARGTGRSGPACACATASGCRASASCA